MILYEVKPSKRYGWVIIKPENGREIFLFFNQEKAEDACRVLNESNWDTENKSFPPDFPLR